MSDWREINMVVTVARSSDTYSSGETQCEYVYMTHRERDTHIWRNFAFR